ncbi:MAG: hypothetical protein QOF58_7985 [Pseudonocardiales bacterium]|jgi:hypothetical protein|nr:hypothetical protein [Pseudonocardiales bacterium]
MLTRPQLSLLRAVRAGHVAWRHHLRDGWAIHRSDVGSSSTGGGLGLRVTAAVTRLTAHGLLVAAPKPTGDGHDVPIELAEPGKAMLDLADPQTLAADTAAAAPHLPMVDDGRERFEAGDEFDAPSGAILDLTEDHPERQGWWQRQGEWWVPVDPPADEGGWS